MGQLSHVASGFEPGACRPWAGQILADLGADVIKVDGPARATTRAAGAAVLAIKTVQKQARLAITRGQSRQALDYCEPGQTGGQAIIRETRRELGHRAGELQGRDPARYHLAYEDLKAVNPRSSIVPSPASGNPGRDAIRRRTIS